MEINVITNKADLNKIDAILRMQENSEIFRDRVSRNVKNSSIDFSENEFWETVVGCLLSTQQNSSAEGAVSRFMDQKPFPLCLEECRKNDLSSYTEQVLSNFGGIRNYKKIGKFLEYNLKWLEEFDGWEQMAANAKKLAELRKRDPVFEDIKVERIASNLVEENLKGFGPKQSRNLWQWMGYTRYEIPIDSRVTKWINKNEILPLQLTPSPLSDKHYYEMVLDWIQHLCKDANILPCLLDAAIFSSYEK